MAKMKKAVTMADIANKLDVSIVTISKALSGQKGVSNEMRGKIIALAREMGYRMPSGCVSGDETNGFRVGVLVPEGVLANYDSFYWRLYQAISEKAISRNCFAGYENLTADMVNSGGLPRMLADQMVDGLILVGRPKAGYTEILKKKTLLPVVYLDFYENDSDIDCFISDNFYGTYLLTEYLIKKGHRQIAFLGTLYETQSITDRYLGFLKALMEHGMNIPENYIIQDRPIGGGTRDLYKKYRLPSPMPSAFVCNCDVAAVNLICELEAMGKKVPNDVSVVGFDHYPTKYSGYLGITTYEADLGALAAQALHSLIRQMKGETFTKGIHIVEGKLVEKESVCFRNKS